MLRKAYVEIGNICNLSCSFCPGTRRAPRQMTPEEFRILAGKLRGHTEYLYFHLMGEPLLHPQLRQLLAIAGDYTFRVMITTNGVLLPARGDILLEAPSVHKVNLSLQAFEGNSLRCLEDYLRGCADFSVKAAERGILCEFRLWNEGGSDRQNEEILRTLSGRFPEPWTKSRNGWSLSEKIWLDRGTRFDWPDLSREDEQEKLFCYGLRDQIGVLCDGTVVPCCLDHEGDIPLGNLFESSLEAILSTPRARAIYDGFSRRKAVEPLCMRCGYARRFK